MAQPQQRESRYRGAKGELAAHLDPKQIAKLVEVFYGEVRSDPQLGPIFNARVGNDWDSHLAKMRRFWRTVLLAEPGYRGNPMAVHRALPDLTPQLFQHWLTLFERSARQVLDPRAAEVIHGKAKRMARALSTAALGTSCV